MKFKVGDKVKFNVDNQCFATEFGFDSKGVYEVQNVFGTIQLKNDSGAYHAFNFDRLELAEPKKSKNQRITELEETVAHLKSEIEASRQAHNASADRIVDFEKRIEALENGPKTMRDTLNEVFAEPTTDEEVQAQDEIIEFEGKQYKKVDREVREGDVVVFRVNDTIKGFSTINKPYLVTRSKGDKHRFIGENGTNFYVYSSDHNRTPETTDVYERIKQEKSPNQQRAEIIEKAKKFVDELVKRGADKDAKTLEKIGNETYQRKFYIVEFKNKPNKVTALVRRANRLGVAKDVNPRHIGSAKCNPSDVFNEHIGKAIALGRALGLDVSEFEQAVQPNEVVVGHKVYCGDNSYHTARNGVFNVKSLEKNLLNEDGAFVDAHNFGRVDKLTWVKLEDLKIINDTNAIYEEGK